MNLVNYLDRYKNISFKESPFNEVDALILSLMSYFPFDLIGKRVIKVDDVTKFLNEYRPTIKIERKLLDIYVLNTLCHSERFGGIKFVNFTKKRNDESVEQFQAVTIHFKDFIFISFCGTDATTLGWREDFNMSFLDIVPSEVDAIKYANDVRKLHPFKKIYIGGHSKGGRLSVRAAKELYKKNNLAATFSFDGPNFTDSFYDETYESMKSLIYEYSPEESIIGRMISDRGNKLIVKSDARLLNQHNAYTWLVEDNHFVFADHYTALSDRITKASSIIFEKYDNKTKAVFVNTLFDLLEKQEINSFTDEDWHKENIFSFIMSARNDWKQIPKEDRKIVWAIILNILVLTAKR